MQILNDSPRSSHHWLTLACTRIFLLSSVLVAIYSAQLQASDKVDVTISTSMSPPLQTEFSWSGTKSFTIDRRLLGQTEVTDWVSLGAVTNATSFTDSTGLEIGKTYEYRLHNYSPRYLVLATASFAAPLEDQRGGVILVVDNTVMGDIAGDLEQFEMDLVGDGWFVKRINFDPHGTGSPEALKAEIQALRAANPDINSLFLCGNVPVASSGYTAPDGHAARPHETDTYYADLDGTWTDTVNYASNPAGDGQFDQSRYPSQLELQTGRVIFDRMSASRKWATDMLRDYLHKNHAWRHAMRDVPYQAAGGDYLYHPLWHNWLSTMLGPSNVSESSGYTLSRTQPLLFVTGRGADGVNPINPSKAIFMSNFQSYRQEWFDDNNANMQNVAQTDWGLNSTWGARPQSFLHAMAAGKTIGYAYLQNQNDLEKSSTESSYHSFFVGGYQFFRAFDDFDSPYVSNNLLGDPTLRLHPVAPPQNLTASKTAGEVQLSWTASTANSLQGYHVYRSTDRLGIYTRLNSSLTTNTNWTDFSPPTGATYYQVRAVTLPSFPTGSYYNQSQGIFALVNADGTANQQPLAVDFLLKGRSNTPLQFSFQGSDPDGDSLTPIILQHPQSGFLRWWKGQWFYVSSNNFVGVDSVTFAMSDGVNISAPATLSIEVDEVGSTLLSWDFPNGGNAPESTFNSPNILPSSISVSGYGLINSWPNDDQFSFRFVDETKGRYAAWTVQPTAGHKMSLDKMHFATAANSDTEIALEVRASLDGFATSFEVPVRSGNSFTGMGIKSRNRGQIHWLDLDTVTQLQEVSLPVQFRVYFWRTSGGSSSDAMCFGKMTEAEGYTDGVEDISITGTVTTADSGPNQPPQGNADSYEITKDGILTKSSGNGVLANDNDPDGNGLYAFLVDPPAQGQVSLALDGSFTYTPNSGYIGMDSFTYRISDGSVFTGPYNVQIEVFSAIEAWREQWFDTTDDTGVAANNETAAGDGISNLMKFATMDWSKDPRLPSLMPVAMVPEDIEGDWAFTYSRNIAAAASGVIYAVKWSDTLAADSWSAVGIGPESVVAQSSIEQVTVMVPRGSGDRRFVRLEVAENAASLPQYEVILDNTSSGSVELTGAWTTSTSTAGYYGSNYLHDGNTEKGTKAVTFTPNLPKRSDYAVYARWPAKSSYAANVPIEIVSKLGVVTVTVDQTSSSGQWVLLGIYNFVEGTAGSVTITNTGTSSHVIVDAVRWVSQ